MNLFQNSRAESTEKTINRLQVKLEDLINLRFHSSGLNFSATLSKNKKSMSPLSGGQVSPFKGRGLDFDEVRPYQPGDDIRNIDWNVTARTNRVHSKVFKEERERPVFIITDFRDSMHFATRGVLKNVQAARVAALSAWIAADQHYRVGGMVFSENRQTELRPQAGSKGVLRLFQQLQQNHRLIAEQARTAQTSAAPPFNHEAVFYRLKQVIKPGTMILFISDFRFVSAENFHLFHYLARHNDFIAYFIYDPLEVELPPPGQYSVTGQIDDAKQRVSNSDFVRIDTSQQQFRQDYRRLFIEKDQFLEQNFNQIGAHFHRIASNDDVVDSLTRFLGHHQKAIRFARSRR